MTMGFGFCPNCGSPRTSAEQAHCGVCGLVFSAAQPPLAAPPPPPAWAQQPPAPPQYAPPAPPQYAPPPDGYPAQYQPAGQAGYPQQPGQPGYPPQGYPQGYMPGYAPAKKTNVALIAAIAGGAGLLLIIVAIIGVVLLAGHGNSYPGSITFSPSTFSCTSGGDETLSIRLPSSVAATDTVTMTTDNGTPSSLPVAFTFTKQSDGSWLFEFTGSGTASCGTTGSNAIGSHTVTIRDSNGKILAEGHYTIKP